MLAAISAAERIESLPKISLDFGESETEARTYQPKFFTKYREWQWELPK
jgi:hypothetical protein